MFSTYMYFKTFNIVLFICFPYFHFWQSPYATVYLGILDGGNFDIMM